jgi:hypothetical protein
MARRISAIEKAAWIAGACGVAAALVAALGGVDWRQSLAPVPVAAAADARGLNERLTAESWAAFERGDFAGAMVPAQRCIAEFSGAADRAQADLEKVQAPVPASANPSEAETRAIFARGLLNDVATCAWIVGRSAQQLGRAEVARAAYEKAAVYSYARCWDPRQSAFWSPAESARDSLTTLSAGAAKP